MAIAARLDPKAKFRDRQAQTSAAGTAYSERRPLIGTYGLGKLDRFCRDPQGSATLLPGGLDRRCEFRSEALNTSDAREMGCGGCHA